VQADTVAKNWADIRVKTEAKNFDAVRAKILGWPEEVAEETYYPQLEIIAQNGKAIIQDIILSSTTPTGEARRSSGGGSAGRYNTGEMYKQVRARVRKRVRGFSAFVGWLEGKPGYTIFQEHGTKNGVKGMEAVSQSREYMLSRIRALAAGRYESPNETDFSGDD
jgi:hypothetical protein